MVVALDDLRQFLTRNGVLRDRSDELMHLIATNHFFIDRDVAEVSPEYRQIIPYVVIRHGEECFVQYSDTDGFYGSRRLADEWKRDGTLVRVKAMILLDMVGDPKQYTNLASRPEHQAVVQGFRAKLAAKLKAVRASDLDRAILR